MAKKSIRAIALQLVLAQLLAMGPINVSISKNNVHKPASTATWSTDVKIPTASGEDLIVVEGKDTESPTYLRRDDKTGEYETIRIFDTQNIISQQYGANQRVFSRKFDKLIQDPYIWEEIQKYFPVENYSSYEEAMFRYEKFFGIINDCGCGYAAAVDFIFRLFEGKEQEFYDAFGFPMYTIVDNKIDFNYEILMLKFFDFYNFDLEHLQWRVNKYMAKSVNEFLLNQYIKNTPQVSLARAADSQRQEKIKELSEKVNNSRNEFYNFGIPMDAAFGYLYYFLLQYDVKIDSNFVVGLSNPQVDQIIGSGGFNLTKLYSSGGEGDTYKYDDHYMYITEILDDGTIVVSSWGGMYKFDNSEASWTDRIVLSKRDK